MPTLTDGTELVGEFTGSGYRRPPHLVHRFDGQVIHLPDLLYETARTLDQQRSKAHKARDRGRLLADVARELSRTTGRDFTAEHVAYVLDKKLAPLGITTRSDGTLAEIAKAEHPILSLRHRAALISEGATWVIAGIFSWLFRPLIVLMAVTAFLCAEIWLFATQDTGLAMARVMADPGGVLTMVGLALASAAFHEMGHAAACRYGNVRPGAMGCGIYLVWPAFYTDVTNSYRLGRAGRLRTDLGGVYFNSLFILGLAALYLRDPCPLLLASILLINLEVVQQLLPTLRFDGYYIMSDLVGIPDLFKYIGPILRRTILRRPPEERLQALKRWPQVVVTIWVLAVLPALCLQLGVIVLRLPQMVTTAWTTSSSLVLGAAASSTPVLSTAAACLQILFILLPLVGVALVLWQLTKTLIQLVRRHYGRHAAGDGAPRRHRHGTPSLLLWGAVASVAVLAVGCLMWTLARPASGPAATPEGRRHTAGANPAPPQGAPPAEVRPPSHTTPPSDPTSTAHGHVKLPHTDSRTAAETRAAQEPPAHRQGTPATTEGPHLDDGKPAGARHTPRPPEPPVADQPAGPGDSAADDCARLMQLPLVPVGVLTICP